MAVTRSWTGTATALARERAPRVRTWPHNIVLLLSSILVAGGLYLVYTAKMARMDRSELLNLNTVASSAELQPFLRIYSNAGQRAEAAETIYEFLQTHRPLRNIGALSTLRKQITPFPLTKLKPLFAVRTPRDFQIEFAKWIGLYFAGFYLVAILWRIARFPGDRTLLPALHILTGFGLILMAGMRDPLRDTLEFRKFAIGVFCGCVLLALASVRWFDYRRLADWCYTPLFAALGLFGALLRFGTGPAGNNDIKVNLGPFQPVELIKILLAIFLAGYFSRNWERLRDLREKKLIPQFARRFDLPRFSHVLPVLVAVGAALFLFFVLKDLGPALVTFFLFLAMFSVARGKPGLAILGVALMVSAVAIGYHIGKPPTVVERINMWRTPWDNDVRGGNQLAHSLWAFATGGLLGSGPGYGDPGMIPAGNTDLVLPAMSEEWGFAGVAAIFAIFIFLVYRSFRIASRATSDFGLFLATGLGCLLSFEMLLISAGVLGALPLSGVVSPFLSSGNTAMLANFLVCAMLVSISANARTEESRTLLVRPARVLSIVLAAGFAGLLYLAAYYQVWHDREYIGRETRSFEEDGVKRNQRNPRINAMAHEIPRGDIVDRNGVLLATSSWTNLEQHRAELQMLGIDLDHACSRMDNRHYPFGPVLTHVIGDLRTGENFHASNASLVEKDSSRTLQGYEYSELIDLIRFRHQPGNSKLHDLMARDRNVHLTIDVRLQLRATEILRKQLESARCEKGALVAIDPRTGDVLAMVSAPVATPPGSRTAQPTHDELLDRARYGTYPPGSTFKIVTAIAALRNDPDLRKKTYTCRGLGNGRVGAWVHGWNRAIQDDIHDHAHGSISMERGIAVSCNAYFAQLGVYDVGSKALSATAEDMGLSTGDPKEFRLSLPFASYGQGPVLITPFKMARVAATIANGGRMPQGRWVSGEANARRDAALEILPPSSAATIARAMRMVVTQGTAASTFSGSPITVAGKTGTAQTGAGEPHAWFAGFAPADGGAKPVAFAVLVEHGGYGGRVAAPIARQFVEAASALGYVQ